MKLENSYDVVIVGAGPGGSITARDCAKAGLKVLLLEKRPEIGAPKRCGEGMSLEALQKIGYFGNERFVTQRIETGFFIAPNGKSIEIPSGTGGYVLERKVFDKFLAYDAAKAGAKIVSNAEAIELIKTDGKISGVVVNYNESKHRIGAKVVVAADGIESKIAKMAGLNTSSSLMNMASGYQYEMAGIDIENPKALYFYFGKSIAPSGYVWIFPKGEHIANVGIGIIAQKDGRTAKHYLDKWIDSMPFVKKGSIIEENAGGIPIGNFLKKMTADNFLAVGDAAHQVNPIHGGGLAEATSAGMLAAKLIVKSIKEGNTSDKKLDEYNGLWWNERGNHLLKLEKLMNAFSKISDDDVNNITNSIDSDGISKIINGDLAFSAKLLMKNPKLIKLAATLI
ncbi:MAG: NAD(P)/FAD-dependent oxidoreductase [Nanoarchaeota archaeon]